MEVKYIQLWIRETDFDLQICLSFSLYLLLPQSPIYDHDKMIITNNALRPPSAIWEICAIDEKSGREKAASVKGFCAALQTPVCASVASVWKGMA